tara:strand:+ start:1165 stop:1503 length:339 start_codon:yes stop_codon:yes gene_type:complete
VKISKRHLRRIIKEEKAKVLKEQFGMQEALDPLTAFGQAWAGLGSAVQEQIVNVTNAYIQNDKDSAYEINPSALDMAMRRLMPSVNRLEPSTDRDEFVDALKWAESLFQEEE